MGIFEGCLFKGRVKAVPVMEFRKRGVLGGGQCLWQKESMNDFFPFSLGREGEE